MIHFSFGTDAVKSWLLNAVLLGYFMVEMSIVAYVVYLIIRHVPK